MFRICPIVFALLWTVAYGISAQISASFAQQNTAADAGAASARSAHSSSWPDEAAQRRFKEYVRPVLIRYCSDCHEPEDGNPVRFLAAESIEQLARDRLVWRSVAEQLRNHTMPPSEEPQPHPSERAAIAEWIDTTLRTAAALQPPFAGWVPARRLNRDEYQNTIRDLIGIEMDFARWIPVDASGGEGFDNNSDTLFLPPMLFERYMECAQRIVDAAIASPPLHVAYTAQDFWPSQQGGATPEPGQAGRWVEAKERISVLVPAHVEGDYRIIVHLDANQSLPQRLTVEVDGLVAGRPTVRTEADGNEKTTARVRLVFRLAHGLHSVGIRAPADRGVRVMGIEIEQVPSEVTPEQVAAHRQLLGLMPGEQPADPKQWARQRLEWFLPRAFRRPVRADEVERYMRLVERALGRGDSFADGMKLAVKAVLVSPEFLFRIESPPPTDAITPVNDYELATRLSYFLWSTMPDDTLLRTAGKGGLNNPNAIRVQVDRMLEDPKSDAFFTSFVGQWLGTRDVGGRVAPTHNAIQHFYTPDIASDMRQEAVLLFKHIVIANRSVLELIDSDYQFMTGRLAKFYGLANASELPTAMFQKVQLPDRRRGGVLGLGAVLALTSHVEQRVTSPVLRGAWVLDTLLGTPVPPPPPDVPPLDQRKVKKDGSLREVLEAHRQHASCAACHDLIDPIGVALENFDYLGRWRDQIAKQPIDATGQLPSGESFAGPEELKKVLLNRKDAFLRHLIRKLLGYALGRGVEERDEGTIERIVNHLEANGYRGRELIHQIALSVPFRNKQSVASITNESED